MENETGADVISAEEFEARRCAWVRPMFIPNYRTNDVLVPSLREEEEIRKQNAIADKRAKDGTYGEIE